MSVDLFVDHRHLSAVNLNLLVAFDALASEGSVTRAAKRLGVRQPAMSHSLARLRVAFGDELFARTASGIRATPRAESLRPHVRAVLAQLQAVLSLRPFDATRAVRTFRLGMTEGVSGVLVPAIVARAHRAAAGVTIDVRVVTPSRASALLDDGALDLAVGHLGAAGPQHKRRVLCSSGGHRVLFAGDGREAGANEVLSLDDYVRQPHLRITSQPRLEQGIDRALARLGHRRSVAVRLDSVLASALVVRASRLLVTLPGSMARMLAATNGLATAPVPLALAPLRTSMTWHASHALDPAQRWLRSVVLEAAGSIVQL